MILALFLAAAVPAVARPACHAVDGDRIRIADLAEANSRFLAAPGETVVGYAPALGARRMFWPAELIRLARQSGVALDGPLDAICIERSMKELDVDEILAAIRQWAPANSQIEITDRSRFPVPHGTVSIPKPARIQNDSDRTMLLRGYVSFGASRFPFWVRVRAHVKQSRVVAVRELTPGKEISADALRVDEFEGGLEHTIYAEDAAAVAGRISRKRVAAGAPIEVSALEISKDVERGAMVRVDVRNGGAHISFHGLAEAAGSTGETIAIRNPSSGKAFRAKVVGPNAVQVNLAGSY